jgi:hypothetical protein
MRIWTLIHASAQTPKRFFGSLPLSGYEIYMGEFKEVGDDDLISSM